MRPFPVYSERHPHFFFSAIENIPKYYFKRAKRWGTMRRNEKQRLYRGLTPAYPPGIPFRISEGV